MTTNAAESVNSMFNVEREFPITALFDSINRRFTEKFHERRMEFIDSPTIFVPLMEKKYQNFSTWVISYWPIKLPTTSSASSATVQLQQSICKEDLVLVEFLTWTKYLAHMLWQRFESNMVKILEGGFMTTHLHIIGWRIT